MPVPPSTMKYLAVVFLGILTWQTSEASVDVRDILPDKSLLRPNFKLYCACTKCMLVKNNTEWWGEGDTTHNIKTPDPTLVESTYPVRIHAEGPGDEQSPPIEAEQVNLLSDVVQFPSCEEALKAFFGDTDLTEISVSDNEPKGLQTPMPPRIVFEKVPVVEYSEGTYGSEPSTDPPTILQQATDALSSAGLLDQTIPRVRVTPIDRTNVRKRSTEHRSCTCPTCKKEFATPASMKTHLREVHSDKRPYVCSACRKGFKRPGDLRQHERIHAPTEEGRRPWVCEVCGRRFTQNGHLRAHQRKKHGGLRR